MTSSRPDLAQPTGPADGPGAVPLTESDAEEHIHGICFKTGPPHRVGVELEWLVRDDRDPGIRVDQQRVAAALAGLGAPGALPGGGRLTTEPGGQVEISSAPAEGLAPCVDITRRDLAALRQAVLPAGLCLAGEGLDPLRSPHRVLEVPRYAAMEEFFNRAGPWGRLMMCSTASVQVCLDAGVQGTGPASVAWRWRLLHALGPVFVAAFANSPLREGRPTGWKSTRQAIWARLDPCRTRPPQNAAPAGHGHGQALDADPRATWINYALAAEVMCVRRPGDEPWTAPAGLTFRGWLRGGGERRPTLEDLSYHLSTLFPPVRPRGHLEYRVIDAQAGDGWIVPAAVVTALLDDETASQAAMGAAEVLWHTASTACGGDFGDEAGAGGGAGWDCGSPWEWAARHGPTDPIIGDISVKCFEAAEPALARLGAPAPVREAVAAFAERYATRYRCPADDRLDEARAAASACDPASPSPRRPTLASPSPRHPALPPIAEGISP
jgi:glutamate--cysteine ligase